MASKISASDGRPFSQNAVVPGEVAPQDKGDIGDEAPAAEAPGKEQRVPDALNNGVRATIHPLFGVALAVVIPPDVPLNDHTLVSGDAMGECLTMGWVVNATVLWMHVLRLEPRSVLWPRRGLRRSTGLLRVVGPWPLR